MPTRPLLVPAAGLGLVLGTAALASRRPGGWEKAVARRLWDLPSPATGFLDAVMQAGNRLAIVVVAAVLLVWGRRRAAAAVGLGAGLAWALAALGKATLDRARPTAAFFEAPLRAMAEGPGYPSSHTAVAMAIAVALVAALRPRPAVAVALLAVGALTGLARVHLGVHWPLDVLGGAGIGILCASVAARAVGADREDA